MVVGGCWWVLAMSSSRTMYILDSKPDCPAETDQAWEDAHKAATRCPGCNRWRADVPLEPVHVRLAKVPRTLIATTGLFQVVARPLVEVLRPYLQDAVIGSVEVVGKGRLEDWQTVKGAHGRVLEIDRGRYSRHRQCHRCGDIVSRNGWSHPVIVERTLDERWLYLGRSDQIVVDGRLLETEGLLERFKPLRAYTVPVVPEPLDGEVLPGDAGWTGTLARVPTPKLPEGKPERGIGLWL